MTSLDNNEKFEELWNSDERRTQTQNKSQKQTGFSREFISAVFLSLVFVLCMELGHLKSINYPRTNYTYTEISEKGVDWWYRYNTICCIETNVTKMYGIKDCEGDGLCYIYLDLWLENFGERFNSSSWIRQCCYEFKPLNSLEDYHTFCSPTCLNSKYIQNMKQLTI
jgi:hypothetical protein